MPRGGHPNGLKNLKRGGSPGRPKGQRDYKTIFMDALTKIGNAQGKTYEEMETMLQEVGIKQALTGNFSFFKDLTDRIHGKTPEENKIILTEEPNENIKKLAAKLNEKR